MDFPLYPSVCGKEGIGVILVMLSSAFQWLKALLPLASKPCGAEPSPAGVNLEDRLSLSVC